MKYPKVACLCVLLSLLGIVGCDFLERQPTDSVTRNNFFENPDQLEQGVIGAYSKLQDVYEDQWAFTEMRSDNTASMWNEQNRGPHPFWIVEEWTMEPSNLVLEPYWQDIYQGIQRSNTVINALDSRSQSSDRLQRLAGEAKFLRALYYFHLARLFGSVPLPLNEVRGPDDAFATIDSRAPVDSVYGQVISDAQDAISLLPAENPAGEGRATEGAARTLLGDAYLHRDEYANARDQFQSVVDLGEYRLLDEYDSAFDPSVSPNEESVFSVQFGAFSGDRGLGNTLFTTFAPHNSGTEIIGDVSANPVGLNIPTRDILNSYEEGDERKSASIGYFVDPDNVDRGIAINDTIPYVKKYLSPSGVRGVTGDDWPVYRYSEVLLKLAEALNELGQTGDAFQYVDMVRNRAGLPDLSSSLSQSEFREAVYQEQRVELAFENDRWYNLLRTERALSVMAEHGNEMRGIQPHWQLPVYQIEEFKLRYPIPAREIDLNPELEQTSGW